MPRSSIDIIRVSKPKAVRIDAILTGTHVFFYHELYGLCASVKIKRSEDYKTITLVIVHSKRILKTTIERTLRGIWSNDSRIKLEFRYTFSAGKLQDLELDPQVVLHTHY